MFKLLGIVSAYYFYHNQTKQFIGVSKAGGAKDEFIVPVSNRNDAIDFKILEGGVSSKAASSRLNNIEKSKVRILHPDKDYSLTYSSKFLKKEKKVILKKSNTKKKQQFELVMLPNQNFVLKVGGKCVRYDSSKKYFKLGKCKKLTDDTFSLLEEAKPKASSNQENALRRALEAEIAKNAANKEKENMAKKEKETANENKIKIFIKGDRVITENGDENKPTFEALKIGHQVVDVVVKQEPYNKSNENADNYHESKRNHKLRKLGFNHI